MPDLVSVSATDLALVAQYAKSRADGAVWNAACRLLDNLHSSKDTPMPADDLRDRYAEAVAEGSYEWYRRELAAQDEELERLRHALAEATADREHWHTGHDDLTGMVEKLLAERYALKATSARVRAAIAHATWPSAVVRAAAIREALDTPDTAPETPEASE